MRRRTVQYVGLHEFKTDAIRSPRRRHNWGFGVVLLLFIGVAAAVSYYLLQDPQIMNLIYK
jgi:hypothetical protein